MDSTGFKRKLSAILSADVVGYSRLMGNDEEATVRTLNNYKAIIFGIIDQHYGRLVDSPGDNLLVEFSSVVDAVRSAIQIQKELKRQNQPLPVDRRMEFRIGIHTGDVIQDGDRIYGEGVNVAARLESLADPGGICLSRTAYDQVKIMSDLDYEYMGEYQVKNISDPVLVYRILTEPATSAKKPVTKGPFKKIALTSAALLLIVTGVVAGWHIYKDRAKTEPLTSMPERTTFSINETNEAKTIAVLPFEDISREKDQEYFVDGLSEEILNSLAGIPDLTVIARTSSFLFKDTDRTIQDIADILGVDYILRGSVRKADNTLRINAQLIDGIKGSNLWSKAYDRELKDILDVQEDIATAVADELKITLGIDRSMQLLNDTDNEEALGLFFKAVGQLGNLEYREALETIDNVIALDPNYAAAWALKGSIHSLYAQEISPDRVPSELFSGLKAAERAIALEPGYGHAYSILGHVQSSMGNFVEAEAAYENLRRLRSGPMVSVEYILHYSKLGYLEKSRELLEKRQVIRDPLVQGAYMLNLASLGNIERAMDEYQHGKSMFGGQWIYGEYNLIWISTPGDDSMPFDEIPDIPMFDPIWSVGKENIDSPEKGLKELQRLFDLNDGLSSNDFLIIACWAAYLGDPELSLDAMDKSAELQTTGLYFIWAPLMSEVRRLPRFKDFAEKVGLVEYWNRFDWPDLCQKTDNGILCK